MGCAHHLGIKLEDEPTSTQLVQIIVQQCINLHLSCGVCDPYPRAQQRKILYPLTLATCTIEQQDT
jgi:hypothetical protein